MGERGEGICVASVGKMRNLKKLISCIINKIIKINKMVPPCLEPRSKRRVKRKTLEKERKKKKRKKKKKGGGESK